jgi:hypothetical protein
VHFGVVWHEREILREPFDRPPELLLRQVQIGQPLQKALHARIDPVRRFVGQDRIVDLALVGEHGSEIGVRLPAQRIELRRLAKPSFGLVQPLLRKQRGAEIDVIVAIVGIERDRALDQGNRFIVCAALMPDDTQQMQRMRMIGIDFQHARIARLRAVQIPGLVAADRLAQQRSHRVGGCGRVVWCRFLDCVPGFSGHMAPPNYRPRVAPTWLKFP